MQAGLLELIGIPCDENRVDFAGFQNVHLHRFEFVIRLRQLHPLDLVKLQSGAQNVKHVIAARMMIAADGVDERGVADAFSFQF